MQNVKMSVKGSILTVVVDLAEDQGKSASGKTTIIASTQGNQPVPGSPNGAIIGMNVYHK